MTETERPEPGPAPNAGHPAADLPVLVGVDGSEHALHAVRWAAREAARRGLPLRIVHGYEWPDTHQHMGDPGIGKDQHHVLMDRACGWLIEAQATARSTVHGLEVSADLRVAHPVELLVHGSWESSMVVVGSRGLGAISELMFGTVATAIAARARCPVVVVRDTAPPDTAPPDTGPVVVGVDGTPRSDAALSFALDAARSTGAELVAVHARLEVTHGPGRPPTSWESVRGGLPAGQVEHAARDYPDVVVHRILALDRPVRALLDEAAGARLLVVGSRGRGALSGTLLGSTSQALLHRAPCPVAVVRYQAPGPDGAGRRREERLHPRSGRHGAGRARAHADGSGSGAHRES